MSQATTNLAALLPSAAGNLIKRQAFGIAITSYPSILGSDVSGVVAAVGSAVTSFQAGDRVLGSCDGIATGNPDHAAFQTYSVVSATSASKLPATLAFKDAATLATAVGTAAVALFDALGLPAPDTKPSKAESGNLGILVWGGASSVGSATVQLARLAGLKVFAAASPKYHDHVRSLGAIEVVDYRSPTAVDDLVAATQGTGIDITLAMDFRGPKKVAKPDGIEAVWIRGDKLWNQRRDLSGVLYNELLSGWLEAGEVVPGKARVVEGGLGRLQAALDELKTGVISGEKLVVEL
ncbi:chaperonin 10-like protein [Chaetomidium leptoderma]|uniref:Chaperonin 10-like protein n=1 Tax=Chaetomidium leptoderma TaxID=669021 RepID=A0AAN6VCA3_9PEZI|nr:chaperonin 10-like protein [Chaetomidium leptoderma]